MNAGWAKSPDIPYSHITLPVRSRQACMQICSPPSPVLLETTWGWGRGGPQALPDRGTPAPPPQHECVLVGSFQNMPLGSCCGEEDGGGWRENSGAVATQPLSPPQIQPCSNACVRIFSSLVCFYLNKQLFIFLKLKNQ